MNQRICSWAVFGVVVCSSFTWSSAQAQQSNGQSSRFVLVNLFQGQEIALPEDFVGRLDGGNLKVALKSLGLSPKNRDRELLVSLIQADGTTQEQKSDVNGEVTFPNVKEGLAALVIASGQSTYAAMALYATPTAIDGSSSTFELPVAQVDSSIVKSSVDASGDAPKGPSLKSLSDFRDRSGFNRFQVYLQPDGKLKGRVIVPESGFERAAGSMSLKFYRNGVLAGTATSADDGFFSASGLSPGIHSVFASGPAGHAAFEFETLPPKKVDSLEVERERPVIFLPRTAAAVLDSEPLQSVPAQDVTLKSAPASELTVLIIPPRLMQSVRDVVDMAYPVAPTDFAGSSPFFPLGLSGPGASVGMGGGGIAGGGIAGGSIGGGAIGGGGLGVGLIGIAGLATALAALSDNDDFEPDVATRIAP